MSWKFHGYIFRNIKISGRNPEKNKAGNKEDRVRPCPSHFFLTSLKQDGKTNIRMYSKENLAAPRIKLHKAEIRMSSSETKNLTYSISKNNP